MSDIIWDQLSDPMRRAIIALAEEDEPRKIHSHTYQALSTRRLIEAEWEGTTIAERKLRVQLTPLGWQVYRDGYAAHLPPQSESDAGDQPGARLDLAFENEEAKVAASIQLKAEVLPRKRFTLVISFDGTETDDELTKIEEAVRYLRERGWTVEEKDM